MSKLSDHKGRCHATRGSYVHVHVGEWRLLLMVVQCSHGSTVFLNKNMEDLLQTIASETGPVQSGLFWKEALA